MASADRALFLGVFEREADVLAAARAARLAGYSVHDAFTPYAVHGLDEAIGLRPSRLPWATLAFALAGLSVAAAAEYGMNVIDWPLNVGGKPDNSLPAFLPAMFELMVLCAGVGTVVTLLVRSRLLPGRVARLAHARVTDDRFVLAVAADSAAFDARALTETWRHCGLAEVLAVPDGPAQERHP